MFPFIMGSKDVPEKSVHSTGVPLSERFKHVPSHNPLRPSQTVRRILPVETAPVPSFDTGFSSNPIPIRMENFPSIGNEAHRVAVLKAKKDAEILRLKAQVKSMEAQLGRVGGDGHGKKNPLNSIISKGPMKNRIGNYTVKEREGGGLVVAPQGGKHLNLQSTNALSFLGIEQVRRNPRSPVRGSRSPVRGSRSQGPGFSKSGRNRKFFGAPKSKTDLDKELDDYMSQCKNKDKTDLDKELDEYMKTARSQSLAGVTGFIQFTPTTPPPDTGTDSDEEKMEIVE